MNDTSDDSYQQPGRNQFPADRNQDSSGQPTWETRVSDSSATPPEWSSQSQRSGGAGSGGGGSFGGGGQGYASGGYSSGFGTQVKEPEPVQLPAIDRLTEGGEFVVSAATSARKSLDHEDPHPLHVVLALEEDGQVTALYDTLGIDSFEVRRKTLEQLNTIDAELSEGDDLLAAQFIDFLEEAEQVADGCADTYINAVHLLLALLGRSDTYGEKVQEVFWPHTAEEFLTEAMLGDMIGDVTFRRDLTDLLPEQASNREVIDMLTKPVTIVSAELGRRSQLWQTVETLARLESNNALLIGDEDRQTKKLARKAAELAITKIHPDAEVRRLDLDAMVAANQMPGMLEQLVGQLLEELVDNLLILLVDDVHRVADQQGALGIMGVSEVIAPILDTDTPVIAATHESGWRMLRANGLIDKFTSIQVPETDDVQVVAATLEELGLSDVDVELIGEAIRLADRYLVGSQPGVTVQLLDRAGARARVHGEHLDVQQVAHVVQALSGVPVDKVTASEKTKLLNLEDEIGKRVIGQRRAVEVVSDAVRRSRAGLADEDRPLGVFLFLGPTGVGKTETAKALAQVLFDTEQAMTRIDMSEFGAPHTVARLIGAPPGYVGFDQGGQLTEAVRKRPYSVVLLDEIEKAHPQVFDVTLQVFDDGRLTDGQGNTVDFRNAIICMTSNLGSQAILDEGLSDEQVNSRVMDAVHEFFRPEVLNRIDESIIFHRLTMAELLDIVDIQLDRVVKRLGDQAVNLQVSEQAKAWLAYHGYSKTMGVRPLKRLIRTSIEDKLARVLLAEDTDTVAVTLTDDASRLQLNGV